MSAVSCTRSLTVVVTACDVASVRGMVVGSGMVSAFGEVTESLAVSWDIVIVSDVVCPLFMTNSGATVVARIVMGSGRVVLSVVVEPRVLPDANKSPLCVAIDSAALSASGRAATSAINRSLC